MRHSDGMIANRIAAVMTTADRSEALETNMAKGQQKSNKETKKPKAEKPKPTATAGGMGAGAGKKK